MLKFVAFVLASVSLNLVSDVLGTATIYVEPMTANVSESNSTTFSCYHDTTSIFFYTISWRTGSEIIADVDTDDNIVQIYPKFIEYFDGSYSDLSKCFNLTLLSANGPLHNDLNFECRVITTDDGQAAVSLLLFVYYLRQGTLTPPKFMIDQNSTEFKCVAEGQPDPTYQWKIASDDTISNLCDINNGSYNCSEDGSILRIDKVDFFIHNTSFFCDASNKVGTKESEPSIPNEDFDFFYCVTELVESFDVNCADVRFKLSVKSIPNNSLVLNGCNDDEGILVCGVNVNFWRGVAKLNHTCDNSVAVRTFPYEKDHICITQIVTTSILSFVGVVLFIAIIFCIIRKLKAPKNITVSKATANKLKVSWTASSPDDTFLVKWKESKSESEFESKEVDKKNVTLRDLTPLTEYKVSVKIQGRFQFSKTITASTEGEEIALDKVNS